MEFYYLEWTTDAPNSTTDDRIPMPVETYSFIHNNKGYVLHIYPATSDHHFEMDTPESIIKHAQKIPYDILMQEEYEDARQLMMMCVLGEDGDVIQK